MKPRHVIILRGLPGSGKTFFSNLIRASYVISMDHFWTKDGQPYKFDYGRLGEAIQWTHDQFMEILHNEDAELEHIIVDNVSYAKEHFQFFVDEAKKAEACVHIVHIERPLNELDSKHGVPEDKILQMAEKWEHIL